MEKIDFVIIWVDGGDRAWQKEKNIWLDKPDDEKIDVGENRYRDWDNLRYWFRAVEKYAPWVNKVHFVTCGHVPPWLNLEAPKLHFVKHSDFIPAEYLPTFSSHPIELNLHRIQGLSERFVYFNDDFFLTAPVKPTDFFRDGLPCDCIAENPLIFVQDELFNHILVNNMVFLNRHFSRAECKKRLRWKWFSPRIGARSWTRNVILGRLKNPRFFGLDYHHYCQPYLKSSLERVWELDPELLGETSSHRFRHERDINQYAVKYTQLMEGWFLPSNRDSFGECFSIGTQLEEICRSITSRQYPVICLNDTAVTDFEDSKARIGEAFEAALPEKSAFER